MAMPADWSISQITDFYASYSKQYDEGIQRDTYPAPFIISCWVLEFLKSHRNLVDGKNVSVLDLGCGTGQSSKVFLTSQYKEHFDVYGVDATPEMLEKAKQYPFTQLLCQDIEAPLPFTISFDAASRVFSS
ncbi:S-adenosyl-L-methionine-dependent methyltransferase [Gaertneriomyces semiglobifer]|nr:S-adenosyl-L-methionine-dependent methyltransferase [Gaertneriomyces semiglobifer]